MTIDSLAVRKALATTGGSAALADATGVRARAPPYVLTHSTSTTVAQWGRHGGDRDDHNHTLRNDVKLLPGERLERVQELEIVDPRATLDPLDELCKLARVER